MSIRLYLGDAVCAAFAERAIGLTPSASMTFEGVPVKTDEDCRPYYDVRNEKAPKQTLIPYPLRDHIECASWWTSLPENCPTQRLGKYTYETAEAIVEPHSSSFCLQARIYGPVLDDMFQLHGQLRTGQAFLAERWEGAPPPEQPPTEADPPSTNCTQVTTGNIVKLTCTSCQAKYTASADKFVGRTVKIKCRTCGVWLICKSDDHGDRQPASDAGKSNMTN